MDKPRQMHNCICLGLFWELVQMLDRYWYVIIKLLCSILNETNRG